ncbi:MAG: lipoate--protein ligase family protein [Candidatus Hodarchaeales archaeon]|jgi:lipoate-protein ligase A
MSKQIHDLSWRIIPYSQNSAYLNMGVDEAIYQLYGKLKINTLRLYGWYPSTVSIGHHQCLEDEIDLSKVSKHNLQAVRRISGGGTVFHDSQGELTYSVVTTTDQVSSNTIEASYYEIVDLLFSPLSKLGITIDYDQIHCPSVFSKGKKISGNAQARSGNVILQHGTILIDYDPELMYSVLKARPGRTETQMVVSVYQKITTLHEQLEKTDLTPHKLAKYIIDDLLTNYSETFMLGELTSEERQLSKQLAEDKYKSERWLHLK